MEMIYSTSASSTGDSKNDSAFLGPHERQMLEQGKKEHRDTTATANRALQVRFGVGDGVRELGGAGAARRARNRLPPRCRHNVCRQQRMVGAPPPHPSLPFQVVERTREVAAGTLVETHRQTQQLERSELGMQQVGGGGWGQGVRAPAVAAECGACAPTRPQHSLPSLDCCMA